MMFFLLRILGLVMKSNLKRAKTLTTCITVTDSHVLSLLLILKNVKSCLNIKHIDLFYYLD